MTGEKLVDSFFSSFFNSKSEGGREKDYHYVDSLLFAVFFFLLLSFNCFCPLIARLDARRTLEQNSSVAIVSAQENVTNFRIDKLELFFFCLERGLF